MPSKCVAVTGGIGSGKSQALSVIKSLGYKVYNLDEIYASLLKNVSFLRKVCGILKVFPIENSDGSLSFDRVEASKKVFSDGNVKSELERFTHPAIMAEFKRLSSADEGIVFCEVPLLYESGLENEFDAVIVLLRPLEERIKSVENRDGLTREDIVARINNQFDYANLSASEHTILIENAKGVGELESEVKRAVEKILEKP